MGEVVRPKGLGFVGFDDGKERRKQNTLPQWKEKREK